MIIFFLIGAPGNPALPRGLGTVTRGRGVRIPNTKPKVYAGSACPPHPSTAPAPPIAWQQTEKQQTYEQYNQQNGQQQLNYQQSNAYGRGYSQQTSGYQGLQQHWQQQHQQQQTQWEQQHQPSQQYYDEYDNYYTDARPARWQQGHANTGVNGVDSIQGVVNMMSNMRTISNQ